MPVLRLMEEVAQRPSRRTRKTPSRGAAWSDPATALLPVLACLLGGATQKCAEGIVVALLGALLIANPPRFSLGAAVNGIIIALVALGGVALLPAAWFFQPAWRQALANDFGIVLPATVSPQPWITFSCLLSFIAGLCWFYHVATQDLDTRAVRHQLRVFAGGVAVLAALAVALYFAKTALPFWHNQRGFGPFPNRNQMANLLGITAVVILACGQDDLRQGRKRWIVWVAGLAVIIAAIVLNFSRAGIAILLLGSGLWLGAFALRSGSTARVAIAASALLVMLTILLIFGGETLERFNLRGGGDGIGVSRDFRWLIFKDALQLIATSPWRGIGLGNFEPVFAIFRDASLGQSRALHPESDWLWLAAEVGWPGVILIVAGATLVLKRVFPLDEGSNQRFRIAALVGAALFGLHGFIDVAGHRVGSALAGVFLLGLAIRRPLPVRASAILTNTFRVLGIALIGTGLTWAVAAYREVPLPGGIGADVAKRRATAANVARNPTDTIAEANRGLAWAPLDWQLYFLRGLGEAGGKRNREALEDFRRARFLEPNSFEVPYQEGLAWITTHPMLAMTAWRESLRRAGPERPGLYSRMLSAASQLNPRVNRMLEQFGGTQPDLVLMYLERANREDFAAALARFLQHNASLQTMTAEQRQQLFTLWSDKGDLARLATFIEDQPPLLPAAWRGVAKYHASRGDFRAAYQLAKQFTPAPKLPEPTRGMSIEQLQKQIYSEANNYGAGFTLYSEQMRGGNIDDALVTIRRF
ncbi:MAG TPA: O-antigen ligase family protein, partial [Chthoniobacterales bacterium]|nr:O-antigen ligase family protein [Chthoniobacterales bacterium]